MSVSTVKVAISLPKETMEEVESLRHQLHLPRSRAVLEALLLWLKKKHEDQKIKQYVESYKKKPEGSDPAADALYRAGLSSFSRDKW